MDIIRKRMASIGQDIGVETVLTNDESFRLDRVHYMSPEELSQAMQVSEVLIIWCKTVQAVVQEKLEQGDTVPGYRLTKKSMANSSWSSAADAIKVCFSTRIPSRIWSHKTIKEPEAVKIAVQAKWPEKWKRLEDCVVTNTVTKVERISEGEY